MQRISRSASVITITTTTTDPTTGLSMSITAPVSAALSKKDNAKHRMNQLAGVGVAQSQSRPLTIDVEIALFTNTIKTHTSFKEFWIKHRASFPRLVYLVHRYCIIPATSVASESAFSISGYIARKQRLSLSSKTLRHLLVLKYRKNLDKFRSIPSPWEDHHAGIVVFDSTHFSYVLSSNSPRFSFPLWSLLLALSTLGIWGLTKLFISPLSSHVR
jgi:hAT family C-terminal dimerisation region